MSPEPVRRHPCDRRLDGDQASGLGLASELVLAQAMAGAGDVDRRQVLASERGTGRVGDRKLDVQVEGSVGFVAPDRPAAEEADPDAAVDVDGEPVGQPAVGVDGDQRPPKGNFPGGKVVVENIDPICQAVDEVHTRAVGAPADAVEIVVPVITWSSRPSGRRR